MKTKIKLGVTGCLGRMGSKIIKSASSDKNFKIVSFTEGKLTNKKISGIKITQNTYETFKKTDLIIDFTVPKCTFEVLKIASKLKKESLLELQVLQKKKKI